MGSDQVSSLSFAASPLVLAIAQSSPISLLPSTGRSPSLAQTPSPSPCYGASPAANHPSAAGSGSCATSSESCAAFGHSDRGLSPSPAPASAPAPASSGGECAFPAFVLSICLATGTPLAPSSAASQHPIASYMAFTPTPTACTNVLPPCVPFVPSLTSTSILSHTPPGSSTAPAGCRSRSTRLSFDVGPGRPPIPPKLVEQIQQGEFIDLADLLPDSLRDNELPQELLLDNQHLLIPKQAQKREVHDIISWVDCWTAYSLVLLSGHPDQAVELLKYQDVIIWTYRSSPHFDTWLHYDHNFRRKPARSPVQLDWGATGCSTKPTRAATHSRPHLHPTPLPVCCTLSAVVARAWARLRVRRSVTRGITVAAPAASLIANGGTSASTAIAHTTWSSAVVRSSDQKGPFCAGH